MKDFPRSDELPELRELIRAEQQAVSDPGPARARLAERLAVQLAGSVAPPVVPKAARLAKIFNRVGLATFAAGAVAGSVLRGWVAPPAPRVETHYVDRVVTVERFVDAGAPPPIAPAPSASVALPRSPRPSVSSTASAAPSLPDADLARERQLIDQARSALARGDGSAALLALEEHARAFPRGQLVEAREALTVQALVDAGRTAEAKARAARFKRAFPGSMYRAVVDSAISSIP